MKPWQVQGFLLDTLRHLKNMEGQFKIKSYGYCELAMLYFPNSTKKSASVQLRRWLTSDNNLKTNLGNSGLKKWQKLLTPKQVGIIVNYIGEP